MSDINKNEFNELFKKGAFAARNRFDIGELVENAHEHLKILEEEQNYLKNITALLALKVADRYNDERMERLEIFKKFRFATTAEGMKAKTEAQKELTRLMPLVDVTNGKIDMQWSSVSTFTEAKGSSHSKIANVRSKLANNSKSQYSFCYRHVGKKDKDGNYSLHMFRGEKASWVKVAGEEVEISFQFLRKTRDLLSDQKRKISSLHILYDKLAVYLHCKDSVDNAAP